MRVFILVFLLSMMIWGNTQPYKKEIVIKELKKASLVQVELDNELYQNSDYDYADIRLHSSKGIEGYFIKPFQVKQRKNKKTLTASSYNREKAKLTYHFKEPFEIEKIQLNIEDRNFKSTVDIYIDGQLYSQNNKIFDYEKETGNQRFTIDIPKVEAKEVGIVYHLDQTTSFYKKYQYLKEMSKYLTIKSVTFSNNRQRELLWNRTNIELLSMDTAKKMSSYVFKTDGIPFDRLKPKVVEKNFKRNGKLYISEDAKIWQYVKDFSLSSSSFNEEKNEIIEDKSRTKFIKLVIDNRDNKALNIKSIELLTIPNYLYFIANPNEKYALYFGEENLSKPSYDVESLVSNHAASVKAKLSNLETLVVMKKKKKTSFFEKYKESIFIGMIFIALAIMAYVAFGLLKRNE